MFLPFQAVGIHNDSLDVVWRQLSVPEGFPLGFGLRLGCFWVASTGVRRCDESCRIALWDIQPRLSNYIRWYAVTRISKITTWRQSLSWPHHVLYRPSPMDTQSWLYTWTSRDMCLHSQYVTKFRSYLLDCMAVAMSSAGIIFDPLNCIYYHLWTYYIHDQLLKSVYNLSIYTGSISYI